MANNVDFITSIKKESDFEEIVRRIAKYIYGAEAYLIGGPYDGGRDLVYKKLGKEVKEAVQISIEKNSIESKILDDARKAQKLVSDYNYPEHLTFFWSKELTASKKLKIKKNIRDETGIELQIYDATEIEQIITEEQPETLQYLLTDIHKCTPAKNNHVDSKARAFYDYLALGKDTSDLKSSIIEAQILSNLFESSKEKDILLTELENNGVNQNISNSKISKLIKERKIEFVEDKICLTSNENIRITNILQRDEADRTTLLEKIKTFLEKEIGIDFSNEALDLIKQAYRAAIEIEISESLFEPPRVTIAKEIIHKLEYLIQEKGNLGNAKSSELAKKLIELGAENEYLSNQCSSFLCVNLLNQKRLDKYIQEKTFYIYLDATVFILYLALFNFKELDKYNKEIKLTAKLKSAIKSLKYHKIIITKEHLEETIRHITQAEKISSFANDNLIKKFGESKNVYFNLYLKQKENFKSYNFNNFLEDLIGYEENVTPGENSFQAYLFCVNKFLNIANISIAEYPQDVESDALATKICSRYEYEAIRVRKSRKHRAALNDLIACYILSDCKRHVDRNGYGHTPMFITWDNTQHKLRDLFRAEYPFAEWLIYSPQRALERLSMVDFKMRSDVIKDNVLAIFDEDYMRDTSLTDTLAIFLGDDRIESDAIISVLTKLSGKIHGEKPDTTHFEIDERNTVSLALLAIQNEFRDNFDKVRKLFTNPSDEDEIINILSGYVEGKLKDDELKTEFGKLLAKDNSQDE